MVLEGAIHAKSNNRLYTAVSPANYNNGYPGKTFPMYNCGTNIWGGTNQPLSY